MSTCAFASCGATARSRTTFQVDPSSNLETLEVCRAHNEELEEIAFVIDEVDLGSVGETEDLYEILRHDD